ncbi:MAG: hypothetical protein IPK81_11720 [Rhodospirillales bacterium]|nr:MAG: hypothetical protein IPK81_11720 [Rhodospirillales bacterium]
MDLARADPSLAPRLLELDWPELHLLAFAMSRDWHRDRTAQVAASVGAPVRDVLKAFDLPDLPDLERFLRHLPREILPEADYRRMTSLLDDPRSADIVRDEIDIQPQWLRNVMDLPWKLLTVPIVAAVDDEPRGAERLLTWTERVAKRRGDPDTRFVVDRLRTARSARSLRGRISRLADEQASSEAAPSAIDIAEFAETMRGNLDIGNGMPRAAERRHRALQRLRWGGAAV